MNEGARAPIRSLSQAEVDLALDEVRSKYEGKELSTEESRGVLSDCIAALGGLFAGVEMTVRSKNWWFFRVRKRSSFNNEDALLKPAEYSYLPAEFTRNAGRCHLPNNPVFYGSDSYDGAIDEMQDENESEYMLSIWKLPQTEIQLLKYLCGSNIDEGSRLAEYKNKILADACDQQNMHDDLNAGRLKAHMVGWSDLFLSKNHSLSACIAYQCTFGDWSNHTDILAYGSAVDGSYINFAIPPRIADKMQLYKIFHIKRPPGTRETTWVSCSKPPFEVWKKATPEDLPHLDRNIPTSFYG